MKRKRLKKVKREFVTNTDNYKPEKKVDKNLHNCTTSNIFDQLKINKHE